MNTPKKIGQYLKDTFSGMLKSDTDKLEESDKSLKWSDKDDTVILKKCEFESLKNELFDQTQIIKKLKLRDSENKSLISEYEHSLASIGVNDRSSIALSKEKMEEEIERLRSNESRLKSHIRALKRDLVFFEEEKENEEHSPKRASDGLTPSTEEIKKDLNKKKAKIQELLFENEKLKVSLTKRCEELVELSVICQELLKDFI